MPDVLDATPYDALLLLSFGGPEGPDDVVPFLENVTRGRGYPHGAAQGSRAALLPVRRGQPHQRPEPRPARRPPQGLRRPRPGPAGLLGQPQLGALPDGHPARDGRRRQAPHPGPRHQRVRLLLGLPPVPREPRRRRWPSWQAEGRELPKVDKLRHYFNHPGFVEPDDRRRPRVAAPPFPRTSVPARTSPSRPTPSRPPRPTPRARSTGTATAGRTSASTWTWPSSSPTPSVSAPASTTPGSSSTSPAPAPRTSRGWSPTSATTWRSGTPPGPRRSSWSHRFRLRPHGGHVRPRHGGQRPRPAELGLPVAPLRHGRRRPAVRRRGPRPRAGARRRRARTAGRAVRAGRAGRRATTCARSAAARPAPPVPPPRAPTAPTREEPRDRPPALANCSPLAQEAARRAGALLRDGRPADLAVAATKSSPIDVVTEMDIAAEKLITRPDRRAPPGRRVPRRGGRRHRGHQRDPLDHRPARRHGQLPVRAAHLGGLHRGRAGRRDRRRRRRGADARRDLPRGTRRGACATGGWDGERGWPAARRRPWSRPWSSTGFNYVTDGPGRTRPRSPRRLIPLVRDIRRGGSAAVDLCDVAAGRLDGYYERGLHPWDLAAGDLIAREAGAADRWTPRRAARRRPRRRGHPRRLRAPPAPPGGLRRLARLRRPGPPEGDRASGPPTSSRSTSGAPALDSPGPRCVWCELIRRATRRPPHRARRRGGAGRRARPARPRRGSRRPVSRARVRSDSVAFMRCRSPAVNASMLRPLVLGRGSVARGCAVRKGRSRLRVDAPAPCPAGRRRCRTPTPALREAVRDVPHGGFATCRA